VKPFFAAIANPRGGDSALLYHLGISKKAVGVLIATATKEIQKRNTQMLSTQHLLAMLLNHMECPIKLFNSEVTSQFSID